MTALLGATALAVAQQEISNSSRDCSKTTAGAKHWRQKSNLRPPKISKRKVLAIEKKNRNRPILMIGG